MFEIICRCSLLVLDARSVLVMAMCESMTSFSGIGSSY